MTSRKDKFTDGKISRGAKAGHGDEPDREQQTARASGRSQRATAQHERVVPDPWQVPIALDQIPETGLERSIVADADQRAAIAELGGLRTVHEAHATLTLQPVRDHRIHVSGRVTAKIGQVCVVSLEDMDSEIEEEIDIVFAPPSKIPPMASLIDDTADDSADIPDPPEPIENDVIDIGRVATDALFLAVDPYPRKADAILELPVEEPDPDEHPFAALKALKDDRKN